MLYSSSTGCRTDIMTSGAGCVSLPRPGDGDPDPGARLDDEFDGVDPRDGVDEIEDIRGYLAWLRRGKIFSRGSS